MRKRAAILHIGAEKTGTSAIQYMLTERRGELAGLGMHYPQSLGPMSHIGLAIYAADEATEDMKPVMAEFLGVQTLDERMIEESLAWEMASLPPSIHTVIFSSEHCHSRLVYPSHVERLRNLLAPYFETVTVLVYLRRQDEMASSSYSTRLRAGEWNVDLLPKFPPPALHVEEGEEYNPSQYFNFKPMLDFYAQFFGKQNVVPRIYDRQALAGGDVLTDFLEFCSLPPRLAENIENMEVANRALAAPGQDFLDALNAFYGADGRQDELFARKTRDACINVIENELTGRPHLPTRAEARAFQAQYAEVNEAVRRDWFPNQAQLFPEDFSRYPETEPRGGAGWEKEVLQTAFIIIEALAKDRDWLMSQAAPPPDAPPPSPEEEPAPAVPPSPPEEAERAPALSPSPPEEAQPAPPPPAPGRLRGWLAAKRVKWHKLPARAASSKS